MTQKNRADKSHHVIPALHRAIVGHDPVQTCLIMSHWFEIHAMTQKNRADKSHRVIPALHLVIVGHDPVQTCLVISRCFEIHAMTQSNRPDNRVIPILVLSKLIESSEINFIFPSCIAVGWFGLEWK